MKKFRPIVFLFLAGCFSGNFRHDCEFEQNDCPTTPVKSEAGVTDVVVRDSSTDTGDGAADAVGQDAPQDADIDAADDTAQQADTADEDSVASDALDEEAEAVTDATEEEAGYIPSINFAADPEFGSHTEYYQNDHAEMMRWIVMGDDQVQVMMNDGLTARRGVGSADDFVSLQLRDKDYAPISGKVLLDPVTETAEFKNLQIKFPIADEYMIRLFADVKAQNISGQHAFDILSADDIGCADQTNITGNFPLLGPVILLGNQYAVQLVYENVSDLDPASTTLGGSATLLKIKITSQTYRLHHTNLYLFLTSRDGGFVRGSGGTFAWHGFEAYDGTTLVSQTTDLDPSETPASSAGAYFSLPLDLVLEPGVAREIAIKAKAAATEDQPGEFIGHSYTLTVKLPGLPDDVENPAFGDTLKPEEISPHGDMEGGEVKVE